MNASQLIYRLKITSAVVIEGVIRVAGEVVELAEREARDLLRREKAVPHEEPAVADGGETDAPDSPALDPNDPATAAAIQAATVTANADAATDDDAGTVPPAKSRRK